MSGINEIKKKAKLSIDEMYQSDGKMEVCLDGKPDNKVYGQPINQQANQTDDQLTKKSISEDSYLQHNQLGGKPAIQPTRQQEIHPTYQPAIFSVKNQQSPKAPTYKMTFNLTEDVYKSFNDLYAHRMLQGRKTEKSEMICEAIEWLIKMEGR